MRERIMQFVWALIEHGRALTARATSYGERLSPWLKRTAWIILGAAAAYVVYVIVNLPSPSTDLDKDGFWHDLLTGPAAAGVLAVVSALIAYSAATATARRTQATAARGQWWDRARWALDKTTSDKADERELGLALLTVLVEDAHPADAEAVLEAIDTDRL